MKYQQLSFQERIDLQVARMRGLGVRAIGRLLGRDPGTISRELRRNISCSPSPGSQEYQASVADGKAKARRLVCRPREKLTPGSELFEVVVEMLRDRFSPEHIAGKLRDMYPDTPSNYVCRETIYNAIYALPVGELRKELVICLRQGKSRRRPRSGGVDRRNQIPDMVSIHVRPPEVSDRVLPGHWEGDLIKGKDNRSAVGTLNDLTTGYVMLIKLRDATATSVVEGFSAALNGMPLAARRTMTYDQGREMTRHAEITQRTGVKIYFSDPHSPWQRGANENINGLIRQYLPKGTDLSVHSQEELDVIALSLNRRPRRRFGFKCPIEMMTERLALLHDAPSAQH